jgi:hypothetical protein
MPNLYLMHEVSRQNLLCPGNFASRWVLLQHYGVVSAALQVLALLRFIHVPAMNALQQAVTSLSWADVTSLSAFITLDCVLTFTDRPAYARVLITAIGTPVMLLLTAVVFWVLNWVVRHAAMRFCHVFLRTVSHTYVRIGSWGRKGSSLLPTEATCTRAATGRGTAAGAVVTTVYTMQERSSSTFMQHISSIMSPTVWHSRLQQLLGTSSASSFTSWSAVRLQQMAMVSEPDAFSRYMRHCMQVTVVVLCYSLFTLVTSSMLQVLACESIGQEHLSAAATGFNLNSHSPFGGTTAVSSTALDYASQHYQWLVMRAEHSSRHSSSTAAGLYEARQPWSSQVDTSTCRLHSASTADSNLCWVAGTYWQLDYGVQCFQGTHRQLAVFAVVGIAFLGVLLPLAGGLRMWQCYKKGQLEQPRFAEKVRSCAKTRPVFLHVITLCVTH